jgi:hypothetical protein
MSSLTILGDTSGSVVLQAPAVSGSTTLTLPATTGTVGLSGPAFSAWCSTNQSIPNATFVVIAADTEEFDVGGCYNNTGSTVTLNGLSVPAYAFCPNVAGYYQVNMEFEFVGTSSYVLSSIKKNNAEWKRGTYSGSASTQTGLVSALIYLNGTGDYLTSNVSQASGSTQTLQSGDVQKCNYFQAFLART